MWIILDGLGELNSKTHRALAAFGKGDTLLLPAALEDTKVRFHSDSSWLRVTVPPPSVAIRQA